MKRQRHRTGRYGRKQEAEQKQQGRDREQRIHQDTICCVLLGILTVFLCWLFCGRYGVFASKVDWMSQHSVIPDYFRQQFYETGQLFPEFAANLGGGQNIYNFSYYGLYSPVILISYLLPFVKMSDYLMAASILELAAAVVLFYRWILSRKFSLEISFITALFFLLAGPMIFQSYSQVMFVNYMPFLCLALFGVDWYFEKGKAGLYTISMFLMILTSFYFSIGGMLVLVLYGLHRYVQCQEQTGSVRKEERQQEQCAGQSEKGKKCKYGGKRKVRSFLADGICFLLPMFTAVLMSGILLVPTAMALQGRGGANERISLVKLLIPDVQVFRFTYTPYGIGLTTLVITVLITGLTYQKWSERILNYGCVLVLTVPLFAYLMNGGLYIRDKVMIPFLPLLCYLLACYLEKLAKGEISFWKGFLPYIVTLMLLYLGKEQPDYSRYWKLVLLDGILMTACYLLFFRKKSIRVLAVPSLVVLFLFGYLFNAAVDRTVSRDFYEKVTNENIGEAVEKVLSEDAGFYRMEQIGTDTENEADMNRVWNMGQYLTSLYSSSYNTEYQEFRQNVFCVEEPFRNILMQSASKNPVFQRFMGVKYLIIDGADGQTEETSVPGYELYQTVGNVDIYRNEAVSPIAYATDQLMSEETYRKLEFPYNQIALLSYTAVGEKGKAIGKAESIRAGVELTAVNFDMSVMKNAEKWMKKTEGGYRIRTKKKRSIKIILPGNNILQNTEGEKMIFLRFRVKNNHPAEDIAVWLEGERNKLTARNHIYYNENTTFTYAAALKLEQTEAELTFGDGDYEISDIECYLAERGEDTIQEENRALYQSAFCLDKAQSKGNKISGNIDVKADGYFITTIPYDSHFEVRVDGEVLAYEKVNTAFLGFPVEKGEHAVELIYHAPGILAGKIVSLAGWVLFFILVSKRKKYIRNL